MIPHLDVTRNVFGDLRHDEKIRLIENLYRSLDLRILSVRGLQRARLIESWLSDPRKLGRSMDVATGIQNMWLNAHKGDSQAVRDYVQGTFAELESDHLFFLRERAAIAGYYRDFYMQNIPSVTPECKACWENLGFAISEYIHKVADLTEVVEEYSRMYRVPFSR